MRNKRLFISVIGVLFIFTAFSRVSAVCIKPDCNPFRDVDGCMSVDMAYDECLRQEKSVREVKERAEREQSEKTPGEKQVDAEKSSDKSQYRFMDDVRELNKSERTYR